MSEVPKFKANLTNDDWHRAIYVAWRKRRQDIPTKEAIRLLWAMWHLETGGNGVGFWNYNFGNMTPGAADSNLTNGYIVLNPSGISPTTGQPYPPMRFASYATADNGAEDWIRYFSRKGWEPVMQALQDGNVEAFNHNLKVRGYYGDGDEGQYLAGLKARSKMYVPSSISFEYAQPTSGSSSSGAVALGVALAVGTALYLTSRK